jgi:glycosyltransferase involved in cell wall biosynthesis
VQSPKPIKAPLSPPGLDRGPEPTFSVLIPAYQAATTIVEAIESVLAQTRKPHEVIVCDDGSTDDLLGAVEPYLDRIVLVRRDNGGGAAALNTAIRQATGDFVAGLDADDAYLPQRVEALSELGAMRPDLDILATNMYFERDGQIVGHMYERREFPVDDQRRAILDWCFLFHPAVRRSRMLEIGGFDTGLRIAYDWDCWLRLILSGSRAGLLNEPLTRYRLVSGSLSDDRPRSLSERVTVLRKASHDPGLSSEERAFVADRLEAARHRALLAEARSALRGRDDRARRKALAVVVGPRMTASTRLKAALAVLSPRAARSTLLRREHREKERFPGGRP